MSDDLVREWLTAMLGMDVPNACLPGVVAALAGLAEHAALVEREE